jgi:hypothetical protein
VSGSLYRTEEKGQQRKKERKKESIEEEKTLLVRWHSSKLSLFLNRSQSASIDQDGCSFVNTHDAMP